MMLLVGVAILPFAWDWRSPFLSVLRGPAFLALITLSLVLIVVQIWTLRVSHSRQKVLRIISSLGLIVASFALITTLALEGRFQWDRYHVLRADPKALERLGRHLIVGYRDLAEIRELVRLRAIAGVFLTTRNVRGKTVSQVRQEIQSLQIQRQEQGLPRLWITTDQEGGSVSRLSPPLTRMPELSEVVQQHSDTIQRERAVRRFAATQGRELAEIGVNMNLAPVVDINHQITNPIDIFTQISKRAISRDPAVVTQVAGWYCAELEKTGVRCTLKHFPGLGRVAEDTHLFQAKLTASVSELAKTDWAPFRSLMNHSRAFVMLSHARLTAIDKVRPVSISRAVIEGMLRGEWKYQGVLITDDFGMRAIYGGRTGVGGAGVEALNAGVDLILISWDPDQFYPVMYALLRAYYKGKLDQVALKRSEQRLEMARRLGPSADGRSAQDKR
jgi:beta-N-acetylhexosaminidase